MKPHKLEINYDEFSYDELEESDLGLIDKAKESAKNAYAAYSNFRVGSCVLLKNGNILCGNNQENAAYPSGLCAERVVLFYANANFPNTVIDTLVIVVVNENGEIIDKPISPCGSCRQVINETENRFNHPIRILLVSKKSVLIFKSIKDLLPLSFG
jgi:cytidine deaminase